MSRDYQTKVDITCDRCGKQVIFETGKEAAELSKWKQLSTGVFFLLDSKMFDLCPECLHAFETDFIEWFPKAFKKAFDE